MAIVKTINEVQDEIIAEFRSVGDPFSQYELLIDYSIGLEKLEEERCADDLLVEGCQSNVWLSMSREGGAFRLDASSDTLIICGILALLEMIFDNQSCEDVACADVYFLEEADLMMTFNSERRKGIGSAIEVMQKYAAGEIDWPQEG